MELKFRKLKADEIDIRVGKVISTSNFTGVTLLLYKDARCDMNILDETVGPMNWQREHTRDNANCRVGIYCEDRKEWIWKEDTGTESYAEAEKGLASDSFKRACFNWGIGRELYSATNIFVSCELDKEGKKPASGISWYVDSIEYTNNAISKLVIKQKSKGKADEVVYELGKFIKKEKKLITKEQIDLMENLRVNFENVLKKFEVKDISELSYDDAQFVIKSKQKAMMQG